MRLMDEIAAAGGTLSVLENDPVIDGPEVQRAIASGLLTVTLDGGIGVCAYLQLTAAGRKAFGLPPTLWQRLLAGLFVH